MSAFGCRGTLLHIYFCCQGSSSTRNERQLGLAKALKDAHCGEGLPDGETISEILELRLDGPSKEEEIACHHESQNDSSQADSSLSLGTFGVLCAEKWLARHGRRFRSYKERSDKGKKRGHRAHSEAWAISAQKDCRNDLSQKEKQFRGVDANLLGVPIKDLIIDPNLRKQTSRESQRLEQFHKTTAKKNQQRLDRIKKMNDNKDPLAFGPLKTGQIFGDENGLPNKNISICDFRKRQIAWGSAAAFPENEGFKIIRQKWVTETNDKWKPMEWLQTMKVLIVDNLADLDYGGKDPAQKP